eukprot:TRINITY_DN5286_c0_g1_i2.p1 TRINITY_DN5286_c0_g1~~TRINITY_DN5286_c0_g1_i2.p1  ORF type:complete len:260 (-),score=41.05 TRINITY_DN5286_c0_g1_i2:12-767(-)
MPSDHTNNEISRSPSPKLSAEEVSRLAERLSSQSAALQVEHLSKLRQKFLVSQEPGHKLNATQQAASVQHLYHQTLDHRSAVQKGLQQKYLGRHTSVKKLDRKAMDASVENLYSRSVLHKQQAEEAVQRKYLVSPTSKKLDEEQMTESLQRLYAQHGARKHQLIEELQKKYLCPTLPAPRVSPTKVKEISSRLCPHNSPTSPGGGFGDWPHTMSEKTRLELEEKYVQNTLPKFPKRGPSDWSATLDRLYKH